MVAVDDLGGDELQNPCELDLGAERGPSCLDLPRPDATVDAEEVPDAGECFGGVEVVEGIGPQLYEEVPEHGRGDVVPAVLSNVVASPAVKFGSHLGRSSLWVVAVDGLVEKTRELSGVEGVGAPGCEEAVQVVDRAVEEADVAAGGGVELFEVALDGFDVVGGGGGEAGFAGVALASGASAELIVEAA